MVISLLLITGWFGASGQSYFNKRYPVDGAWGGGTRSIVLFNNGLYMNVFSIDDALGTYQITLAEVDTQEGDIENLFNIKTDSIDYFSTSLIKYSKGGFVDVLSSSGWNQVFEYGVIRYSDNGDTVFYNLNPDSALFLSIFNIKETNDKGFILTGAVRTVPISQNGTQDLILIKTDSLGNEQWRKIYGLPDRHEQGHSVQVTSDGGYIVSGIKGKMAYVLKTDSLGNLEWDRKYGHPSWVNKPAYSIIQTQDGGYAFVGAIAVEHFTGGDRVLPWIVKTDAYGDTLWTRINTGTSSSQTEHEFKDIIEISDGSYVVCGEQYYHWGPDSIHPSGINRILGVISKYDIQGNQIWVRYYIHPELVSGLGSTHILNSIVQTPDGGFAAAGWLYPTPPDTGTQDTWIIKTDSFGCLVPGCHLTGIPKIASSIASLKIYPNPAAEVLHIDITPTGSQHTFTLELFDMSGRRVLYKKLLPFENSVNVRNLPSGVYNYRIGEVWGQIVK